MCAECIACFLWFLIYVFDNIVKYARPAFLFHTVCLVACGEIESSKVRGWLLIRDDPIRNDLIYDERLDYDFLQTIHLLILTSDSLHIAATYILRMQQVDVDTNILRMYGNSAVSSAKSKHAAVPIYRPPSLRDGNIVTGEKGKLNVHAKEFVMNNEGGKNGGMRNSFGANEDINIGLYKSKDFAFKVDKQFNPLKSSKSSGFMAPPFSKPDSSQIAKTNSYKVIPNLNGSNSNHQTNYGLQRTKSIGDVLLNNYSVGNGGSKVQFKSQLYDKNNNKSGKISPVKDKKSVSNYLASGSLKRSKSLGAADALKLMEIEASFPNYPSKFSEYHLFPEIMRDSISQAVQNANRMSDKNKIILARFIAEHTLKDGKCSLPAAKLCTIVMEKDKNGSFSDSLLNTCQMLYEKRETTLFADTSKFTSFLYFLTEMFSELKRSKLQIKLFADPITPPKITLLILISRCCEDILLQKETHSLPEIECLFLTLTAVGRDIENELPAMFVKLFTIIRAVFLKSSNGPQIQKTLLQLIELRAANWQLPVSALNYYYPKSSN